MPTVRPGPLSGIAVQIVLLAGLDLAAGLGAGGWAVGTGYAVVTCAALTRGMHRSGVPVLGPANRVTLARATLVGCVAALAVDPLPRPAPVTLLVGVAAAALVLDAVDGQVARRTGTVSPIGARFDMEVDASLLLVLSVQATHEFGGWVLAIGGMRYAFVAAAWAMPWLREPLPPRFWRKVVAATQGVVLVSAVASVLPWALVATALAVSLVLLVESFGRDVGWLWRRRPARVPLPAAIPGATGGPGRTS